MIVAAARRLVERHGDGYLDDVDVVLTHSQLPEVPVRGCVGEVAHRLGLAPQGQPTREIAKLFWDNIVKTGRVNELKFSLAMYFKDGFGQGIKNAMAMQGVGLGLVKAGRLNPMEILGGHSCKDKGGIQKMIAKAQEIENRKKGLTA